jgi:ribosomal protein S18 acetylase RimI-like enzyme
VAASRQVGPFAIERHELGSCALRPIASEDEANAIAAMMVTIDPWKTLGYAAGSLARGMTREDASLARYAIEPLGYVAIRYPWLRGSYLETIAIDPAHQGRGIGAAVLDWWERTSRAVAPNLWLLVSEFNAPARRFYARHGFVEIAPLTNLVKPGVAEVLLRKDTAAP